ncbi:MAG: MoaD/ThiS family protein [Flavobacteriales bacterium]|jgi:molybdopterin converting factor small subunit|nr:MoaD/ThiS family protein [Flavobacteriales bacterium]MBZ0205365.1 MoaD/ThiS family protein [Flavobacteriales bacterium]MCB0759060.1 MoaD/ThiS family protein [Flavobacteriales bacterium]
MDVKLFGLIAEKAGTDVITLAAPSAFALKHALEERIEGLASLSYAIAVNQRITREDVELNGTEEVALLPPFAGG